ncbi:MAG: hypothetical protein KC457_07330 [Myxococcales bacterium]|nr:hypothetical protein [Myxococcales bacterium]
MAAEVAARKTVREYHEELGDDDDGAFPDDSEWELARAVARALAIEHDVALALCEAAGWPDVESGNLPTSRGLTRA